MTSINIQRDVLRAVSRFMAKEDVRYYLNGVLVEVFRNVAYLVATDGYRLAVARLKRPDCEIWEPCEAIIPGEAVTAALKSGNAAARRIFPLVLTIDGAGFTFNACGAKTAGELIEGRFPYWRKVIPRKVSGERAHFNAEYLMDAHKAAEDLGCKFSPPIGHNGDGPAILELREDVLAVIMPMHADAPEEAPAWVGEDSENVGRTMDPETAHGEALAEDLERAWDEALAEYAARELGGNVIPLAIAA